MIERLAGRIRSWRHGFPLMGMSRRLRLLALLAVIATAAAVATVISTGTPSAPQKRPAAASGTGARSPPARAQSPAPGPLHGVPLVGSTELRLLVSADPPFLLNVDTGTARPVTGLNAKGNPTLTVLAVGRDAVLWLDRRTRSGGIPRAAIYLVRHGTTKATRIATGWGVAPANSGKAIWLLNFEDAHHCTLSQVGLDGRTRQRARSIRCSTQLLDTGSGAVLVHGRTVVDPATGRTLLHTGSLWAIAGERALTSTRPGPSSTGPGPPLTLTDLRTGTRWRLPWPSRIRFTDQAVVRPHGRRIALDFADPAYAEGGTQVTDVWLLDPATRHFRHVPDMPAAVHLKFTSMAWASDGRLVMLAQTDGPSGERNLVAVWKPGRRQIALRPVRLPERTSGSDTFVIW
jgi:hypothetical protein